MHPPIHRAAIISSIAAPIIFIGTTIVAESLWPAFDPIKQTVSELAAGDAPTRVLMTIAFVLTGFCHIVTGSFARGIGVPGRLAIVAAGFATLGVAIFPLPTVAGTSVEHRLATMVGFIILAIWPVLGMRLNRSYPWIIRPAGAIISTAFIAVFCFWFLAVWSQPALGYVGIIERVAADLQSLWPAVVVLALVLSQKRARQTRQLA
jgi:hypothetical membrane protein